MSPEFDFGWISVHPQKSWTFLFFGSLNSPCFKTMLLGHISNNIKHVTKIIHVTSMVLIQMKKKKIVLVKNLFWRERKNLACQRLGVKIDLKSQ